MDKDDVNALMEEIRQALQVRNLYQFGKQVGAAQCALEHSDLPGKHQVLQSILIEEVLGLYHLKEYEQVIRSIDDTLGEIEDTEVRQQLLHKKGAAMAWLGQLPEALDIFEELAGAASSKVRVHAMNSIAWVYLLRYQRESKQEYLDLAETYARDGIDYARDADPELYVISLRNLGNAYWDAKKYEKALDVFLEVNELYNGQNPKAINNIAATYVSLGNADSAKEYLQQAEYMAERTTNAFELGQCYYIYGRIEEELLDQHIHAKDFYLAAFDYYIESRAFDEAVRTYKRILAVDRGIHEDALAFLAQKLATQFKKEIA